MQQAIQRRLPRHARATRPSPRPGLAPTLPPAGGLAGDEDAVLRQHQLHRGNSAQARDPLAQQLQQLLRLAEAGCRRGLNFGLDRRPSDGPTRCVGAASGRSGEESADRSAQRQLAMQGLPGRDSGRRRRWRRSMGSGFVTPARPTAPLRGASPPVPLPSLAASSRSPETTLGAAPPGPAPRVQDREARPQACVHNTTRATFANTATRTGATASRLGDARRAGGGRRGHEPADLCR